MAVKQTTLIKVAPWALTITLFLVWEIICTGLKIPDYLMPAPSAIWVAGVEYASPIMMHATQTLFTTLAGFALAVVVGMLLGLAAGASPLIYKATYPLLVGFNSIPKVASVPVLVVWFGSGTVPAILTPRLVTSIRVVGTVASS